MKFFLDRNVSPRLASIIDIFDRKNHIEHHDTYFTETTTDIEWMTTISQWKEKPVVVSADNRILRSPAESQVLRGTHLTFFILEKQWARLSWDEQVWRMIKIWPLLVSKATTMRPTVFKVSQNGKFETVGLTSVVGSRKR